MSLLPLFRREKKIGSLDEIDEKPKPDWGGLLERAGGFFVDDAGAAKALSEVSDNPFQVAFRILEMHAAGKIELSNAPLDEEGVKLGYALILQRRPEGHSAVEAQLRSHSNRASLIGQLFASPEWKNRSPELVTRAFPHMRRIWHPHIPKTGGTSFVIAADRHGCGRLNINMMNVGYGISGVSNAFRIGSTGELLITGHYLLPRYLTAIQPFDVGISVIRDPVERVKSMFHFVCDMMDGSPNVHKTDPKAFLDRGFDRNSIEETYYNGFFIRNEQCLYISQEIKCNSAIENSEKYGIILLTINHLDSAIRSKFGIESPIRSNVSSNLSSINELDKNFIDMINNDNSEDYYLYMHLKDKMHIDFPDK